MTSLELRAAIEGFLTEVADETALMQMLTKLSAFEEGVDSHFGGMLATDNSAELNQRQGKAREFCRASIARIREFRASVVIKEMVRIEQAVERFYGSMDTSGDKLLKEYTDRIHQFRDAYDGFVATYNYGSLAALLRAAQSLVAATETSRSVLRMVRDSLLPEVPALVDGDETMSFHFEGPVAYDDLVNKLAALREVYDELCRIAGIDREQHPLQLVHMETGSLDLQVAGAAAVLWVVKWLLSDLMAIYQRYIMADGRALLALETRLKAVKIQTELVDRLREQGLDPAAVESQIQQSAEKLASAATRFVSGSLTTVNGQRIATTARLVTETQRQKMLPPACPKKESPETESTKERE